LAGKLALRDALKAVELRIVELDPAELVNVNTKADLRMLKRAHA
jgi:CTP:molybdopterin cytidylyltransferase MocA